MKIDSQINNFPGCADCRLLQKAIKGLKSDPELGDKEVILAICQPVLSFWGNRATFIGPIDQEGRFERLRRQQPNKALLVNTGTIEITERGTCLPLERQRTEDVANKIFEVLHLE